LIHLIRLHRELFKYSVKYLIFFSNRLVNAGYKVGVVRQTETAALKAVGDNKQGPFLRELKNLYTKGTFVDEMIVSDIEEETGVSPGSNYLMCIVEEMRGGGGPDERVRVGIVVRYQKSMLFRNGSYMLMYNEGGATCYWRHCL
jgi:hypothetical protein